MRTNEATRAPQEVVDEATEFMDETCPLLVSRCLEHGPVTLFIFLPEFADAGEAWGEDSAR